MTNKMKRARRFAELVALRLKAEMAAKSVSAKEVSEATGIARTTFSNYFTLKREMPMSFLHRVCEYMGVDPKRIFNAGYQDLIDEMGEPDEAKPAEVHSLPVVSQHPDTMVAHYAPDLDEELEAQQEQP